MGEPTRAPSAFEAWAVRRPGWFWVAAVFAFALPGSIPYVGAAVFVAGLIAAGIWRAQLGRKYPELKRGAVMRQQLYEQPVWENPPTIVPVSRRRAAPQAEPRLADIAAGLVPDGVERELDEQIEAAGETHHMRDIKTVFKDLGVTISANGSTLEDVECALVPEPWNPHDQNAVAIMVGIRHVGYLPAELAGDYSRRLLPLAQRGAVVSCSARIWAKRQQGGTVRARVTVMAPEPWAI